MIITMARKVEKLRSKYFNLESLLETHTFSEMTKDVRNLLGHAVHENLIDGLL